MKVTTIGVFCWVLCLSVFAATHDWGDAGSREEMKNRLKEIDRLFIRQDNIQTFIEALDNDGSFGIGVLTFDSFYYRRFLISETCGKGREEVVARRFLNELLEITQSKLDSLMEIR